MLSPAVWRDNQKQDLNRLQDILEAQERQLQEMAESLKNLREAVVDDLVPNCKNNDMNIWCFQNGSGYGANSTRSHLFRRRGTYFKQHCE